MINQSTIAAVPSVRYGNGSSVSEPGEPLGGSKNFSELLGRYSSLAIQGKLFSAFATVTSGVIFSTAAGTGGPLLWNGTAQQGGVSAHILAVMVGGVTAANTVPTSIGLTGNVGQTIAPTATTAIDASGNALVGAATNLVNAYRIGTVTNAGNRFMPLASYGTGAVTVSNGISGWIDVGGAFIIPPQSWGAVSFANTATTGVIQLGVLWTELPV